MIYMRGLKSEDLIAMIDFIYFGEANVFQENLDSFLALAEELQFKWLTGQDAGQTKEQEVKFRETVVSKPKNPGNTDFSHMENNVILPRTVKENIGKTVALTKIDTEGIGELAKSLMEKTSSATPDGKRPLYVCKICGKEGQSTDVQRHIEAKHLEGAALPCNICGKTSRSRNALGEHKRTYHQTKSDQFISLSPQDKRRLTVPQSKVSSNSMNWFDGSENKVMKQNNQCKKWKMSLMNMFSLTNTATHNQSIFRDGSGYQNGWISEKLPKGGGSFSIKKIIVPILDLYIGFFRTFAK